MLESGFTLSLPGITSTEVRKQLESYSQSTYVVRAHPYGRDRKRGSALETIFVAVQTMSVLVPVILQLIKFYKSKHIKASFERYEQVIEIVNKDKNIEVAVSLSETEYEIERKIKASSLSISESADGITVRMRGSSSNSGIT